MFTQLRRQRQTSRAIVDSAELPSSGWLTGRAFKFRAHWLALLDNALTEAACGRAQSDCAPTSAVGHMASNLCMRKVDDSNLDLFLNIKIHINL